MSGAISAWLQELELDCHVENFVNHDIEPLLMNELTDADLKELGTSSLDQRKKLLKATN